MAGKNLTNCRINWTMRIGNDILKKKCLLKKEVMGIFVPNNAIIQ